MDPTSCFKINTPGIIYEQFEDEIVVVNLDTGTYYNVQHSGTTIWNCLLDEKNTGEIISEVHRRFQGESDQIRAAIFQFLDKLLEEKIITPLDPSPAGSSTGSAATTPDKVRAEFVPPEFSIFSDMQDLLLLDPIHEVDDSGWPTTKN